MCVRACVRVCEDDEDAHIHLVYLLVNISVCACV